MANQVIRNAIISRLKPLKPLATVSFSSEPSWIPKNPETHTGQQFEENDCRLARFVDKEKHVNPNFAINLVDSIPPEPKKARVVWCDGGSGPTGHPRVYINLDKPGDHICGYCGLRFYKEDHHDH